MEVRSIGQGLARLSPGQVQCMLLVGDHLTSKEIAQRLGISPHTVDQRIRRVLRVTGMPSRREAARLIKQAIELKAPDEKIGWSDVEPLPATKAEAAIDESPQLWLGLLLPFATRPGQLNRMGTGQRLFWIVAIAGGAFLSSAMYLAGLESLARLFRSS